MQVGINHGFKVTEPSYGTNAVALLRTSVRIALQLLLTFCAFTLIDGECDASEFVERREIKLASFSYWPPAYSASICAFSCPLNSNKSDIALLIYFLKPNKEKRISDAVIYLYTHLIILYYF